MSSIWTIRRSATDAKLTGLCGGVAEHWGIDPVLVRVGWALLALSGGIGVVLYVAGWLLIPIEGSDRAPVDDYFGSTGRRWPREVWVTLVVIACLAAFAALGSFSPFGIAPAVVLAMIWYFGFYKKRTPQRSESPTPPHGAYVDPSIAPPQFFSYPGPATPFTEAAQVWRQRVEQYARHAAAEPPRYPAPAPTPPSPPASGEWATYPGSAASTVTSPAQPDAPADPAVVERSAFLATADPVGLYVEPTVAAVPVVKRGRTVTARRLRLVTLFLVGLALAGLAVADGQGVHIPVTGYLATTLLIIGVALVAATWLGRAPGLLPVGILVTIALLSASAVGSLPRMMDLNSTTKTYVEVAQLPDTVDSREFGRLRVDLSRLEPVADLTYRAHVDAGNLEVVVPKGVNVVTDYTVDAGAVEAYGNRVDSGTDLHNRELDPAHPDPARPTLTLELSVDLGNLEVRR
jgi:phage shock protein PspC (stress-responsive transcriptional regulator)